MKKVLGRIWDAVLAWSEIMHQYRSRQNGQFNRYI